MDDSCVCVHMFCRYLHVICILYLQYMPHKPVAGTLYEIVTVCLHSGDEFTDHRPEVV